MRRFVWILAAISLASSFTGCIVPAYSGDPARRTRQLIHTSENLRLFLDDWERFWLLDQPDHMTPYRNDGGII